jgi:D-cysteine desulfhydrase
VAQGSGTQPSGLILGFKMLNAPLRVIGIGVSRPIKEMVDRTVTGANNTAKFIGTSVSVTPEDVEVYDNYMGQGYGVTTKECVETIRLVARLEGIFLDPVYTGKAMVGLIGLVRSGRFTKQDAVLYIHTGGQAALFAYAKEMTGQ